jgi:hypothetical protein
VILKKKYVARDLKQNRGFRGLYGVSFGKTPSPKPLQGMGCGQLPGYSGFYFNYREIF